MMMRIEGEVAATFPNEIQVETLCKTDGVPLDIAGQATLVS